MTLLEGAATGLALIGAVLNARARVEGFYVWIVADALWIWWALGVEGYGLAALMLVYIAICIGGIRQWRRAGP